MSDAPNVRNVKSDKADKAPDMTHGASGQAHSLGADRWEQRQRANRLLLDHLLTLWDAVPDWRFGQLVMNLSREPGGFADTWEWSHSQWRERIEKEYAAWVK